MVPLLRARTPSSSSWSQVPAAWAEEKVAKPTARHDHAKRPVAAALQRCGRGAGITRVNSFKTNSRRRRRSFLRKHFSQSIGPAADRAEQATRRCYDTQ